MINSGSKSSRLLASRRYTHDTFTDSQESFTNVLDLQASEVYTQAHKIPSGSLPFSGSSQDGSFHVDGEDNILRYYYRHKLTKSNLNNEVWFFLNPTGSASGVGAQLIDDNQQTSFISPKYSISSLANANAEDDTPGYLAKVFISTAANSSSVSDSDVISVNNYQFDYKTGVLQFLNSSVDPSDSQYVYMSVNQYVGKTLADGLELTSDISGSATSTGSFGHLVIAGDITASGTVRADAFESMTGGETIDFGDSVNVSGNVTATNLVADSGSVSDRLTAITSSISALKLDSGSISIRLSDVEAGSTSKTLISSSAQIAVEISGSFVQDSSSFSTRITQATSSIAGITSSIDALKSDSGSFSTRITQATASIAGITSSIDALKVDSSSFSTRITQATSSIAGITSSIDALKVDSSSISTRLTTEEINVDNLQTDSASFSVRITQATASIDAITSSIDALKIDSASLSLRSTHATSSINALKIDSASFSLRATQATSSIAGITASIDALKVDSGSMSLRMTQATASIFSITSSISALKVDSGSISTRLTTEESNVDALQIDSASFSTRVTNLKTDSGSFSTRITQATASIDAITSSIDALKVDSSSFSQRITQATSSIAGITSSIDALKADSSSFSSRTTFLEGSGEIQSLGTTNNVLFSSITGSDNALFQKDVVVLGRLTAQEIHTEIESASIIFTSGSTKFGDTPDDTHQFTGSIFVKGNLTAENLTADSSSVSTRLTTEEINVDNLQADSASFSSRITADSSSFSERITSDSSSISTRLTTEEINVDALQADSASFSTRITTEEINVDNLQVDSSSFSTRITQATSSIAGITSSIDALKIDSSSFSTKITQATASIAGITASIDALKTDSGSFSLRITQATSSINSITSSINALKVDSASLSLRSTHATSSISALKTDSGSFSLRATQVTASVAAITSSISALKVDSGSFSTRITTDSSSLETRITQATASIAGITASIDALKVDSSSFSTRITQATASIAGITASINALKSDSGSFSTRITNFTTGNVELVSGSMSSTGSFGRVVTTDLLVSGESTLKNKVILKHDSSNAILELRSTGGSRINEYQNFNASQIYNSLFLDANAGITVQDGTYSGGNTRARIFSIGHIDGTIYHQFGNENQSAKQTGMGILDYENISGSLISTGSFGYLTVAGLSNPNLIEFSSSLHSKITSITSSISALKIDSGSFSTRITQATASIAGITSSIDALKVDSSSISTRLTTEEINVDALQVDSASFSNRLTTPSVVNITASNNVHFQQDLKVDGKVTAQEFHTEVISSSIVFTSGSTKFGDSSDDKHSFTGSINLRGSEIFFGTASSDRTNITLKGNQARIQYRHYTNNELYTYLNLASGGSTLNTSFASDTQELFKIQANESTKWKFTSNILSGSSQTTASFHHIHGANKLGVGTESPISSVHISASDGIIIPIGTDAQRNPAPVAGEIRFNTQQSSYEGYDGNNWGTLGGMTDVDKDTKITSEDSAGVDNDELKFFTAGDERLRIFADGHISASGNITASSNLRVDGDLIVSGLTTPNIFDFSSSLDSKITSITSSVSALKSDSGSFSTRITQATASINSITSSISALKVDSGSFSVRITQATSSINAITSSINALKIDSGSFSTRVTRNEISASSIVDGTVLLVSGSLSSTGSFGRILGRSGRFSDLQVTDDLTVTDDVGIGGVLTATGGTKLGNALSDVHEITGSLTISSNNLTVESNGSISASSTSTGSFGIIKENGINLNEQMSRNVFEAFELDSNGDFQPTPSTGYMVDPKWELDEDGNLQRRKRELWTFNWDEYFSD